MERDEYTDRYVNPYTDFGFKKLFGTEMNKELLISFINSLLSGKEQIRDLTYLNTENLGISEADRKAVFDVYCETDSGEKILVEMQRGQQLFFKERSLYYASFPIQQQGKRGDWDYQTVAGQYWHVTLAQLLIGLVGMRLGAGAVNERPAGNATVFSGEKPAHG